MLHNLDRQTVLLTGTIDSSVYENVGNLITDCTTRLKQYELAIERYILESVFTDIVFIENSNYPFEKQKYIVLAEKYGKRFEFVQGKVCKEDVIKYGKSFGDAYLIYEALEKSALLKECDYFYKITGRIFLKNSKQICKTSKKYRNEFIIYRGLGWCLTNIFKVNKDDYKKYLLDIWKDCDESKVNDIEISFYRRLISTGMELKSFETYPYFDGIMGATLKNYSGSFLERSIRNLMAKLHCFSYDSRMSIIIEMIIKLLGKKSYIK